MTPKHDSTQHHSDEHHDTAPKKDVERRGLRWTQDEEQKLYDAFCAGASLAKIAKAHGRTTGGIGSHLQKLGLLDMEGKKVHPAPPYTPTVSAQKRTANAQKLEAKIAKLQKQNAELTLSPELNERFKHALDRMENTDQHLFLTGKAGTGKSTLLAYFCAHTTKNVVVLAPTGVAALNVRGQTIHRFFNFYLDVTPHSIQSGKTKPRDAKLYKKIKTLVIDEASMLRADLLDCIDVFLRRYGPEEDAPFGGVQMIFIGDLYQLPPVVTKDEQALFDEHYETPYFFSAHALRDAPPQIIELDKIYRQKDGIFVELLNKIRNNSVDDADLAQLNSRYNINETGDKKGRFITLTTTNAKADEVNDAHLAALKGHLYHSKAEIEGNFTKDYYPTALDLTYKIGAQIMLLNNDTERRWVNGSIGTIESVNTNKDGEEFLRVHIPQTDETVDVLPHTWEVYQSSVHDGTLVTLPVGTFTQFPFRLAWAITIHKSQGKTFDNVVIDIGSGTFAAGQMYVALSRCTSFEGVILKTPIRKHNIRTDHRIFSFLTRPHDEELEHTFPLDEKISLIKQVIKERGQIEITYLKADETKTTRIVIPSTVGEARYQGTTYQGMKASCTLRGEERMFRVDRILDMRRVEG